MLKIEPNLNNPNEARAYVSLYSDFGIVTLQNGMRVDTNKFDDVKIVQLAQQLREVEINVALQISQHAKFTGQLQ